VLFILLFMNYSLIFYNFLFKLFELLCLLEDFVFSLCCEKKSQPKNGVHQSCFEKNRKRKKIEVAEVTKRGLHLTLEIRKNMCGFEN